MTSSTQRAWRQQKRQHTKKWRWIERESPEGVKRCHEDVFLTMRRREMVRRHNGPREREKQWHAVLFLVMLILIYSASAPQSSEGGGSGGGSEAAVILTYAQIVVIGVWALIFALISAFLKNSRYSILLVWMFIYLPLCAMVAGLLFTGSLSFIESGQDWIGWVLLGAEIATVLIFVWMELLVPRIIESRWLRERFGVSQFWKIRLVSDWTMTYAGWYGFEMPSCLSEVQVCRYDGETNDAGLPHGSGRWMDDARVGEILSGQWRNGAPVAPFESRVYGTGDAFAAVRLGYFMASDDDLDTTKLSPTNERPPRVGVLGVECSIHGRFYSHLPAAVDQPLSDVSSEVLSVGDMIRHLLHLGEEELSSYVGICVDECGRGVNVVGHVYGATGSEYSDETDGIRIRVVRKDSSSAPVKPKSPRFMPRPSFGSVRLQREHIMVLEDNGEEEEEEEHEQETVGETSALMLSDAAVPAVRQGQRSLGCPVALDVESWIRRPERRALVFFPGFNCSLKQAAEAFGQFVAMAGLTRHVYPVCFGWPCGQLASYRNASTAANSFRNRENVSRLFRGLSAAGVRHLHLMSHSMGAQTLLGIFEDGEDGSRSEASALFRLDPVSGGRDGTSSDDGGGGGGGEGGEGLLVCKTLTLLNPDFPVDAFVDHMFVSIRRICNHITVVGDSKDVALQFGSKIINGVCNSLGYQQPTALMSREQRKRGKPKGLGQIRLLGSDFDMLYWEEKGEDGEGEDNKETEEHSKNKNHSGADDMENAHEGEMLDTSNPRNDEYDDRLVFKEVPPVVLSPDGTYYRRRWLDVDVIDTTSLDTNIAGIRHSGFNMNPILRKDLEELIVTGKRASDRSTCLYRDGNIFTYCHAPSHVAM